MAKPEGVAKLVHRLLQRGREIASRRRRDRGGRDDASLSGRLFDEAHFSRIPASRRIILMGLFLARAI